MQTFLLCLFLAGVAFLMFMVAHQTSLVLAHPTISNRKSLRIWAGEVSVGVGVAAILIIFLIVALTTRTPPDIIK